MTRHLCPVGPRALPLLMLIVCASPFSALASEWPEPLSNRHLEVRHGLGTSGIARLPEFPYEATTLAQDALIERARKLAGDHREHDALLACELLMNDPKVHPDLRRWAALERITLLCYSWREPEAVAEAREWLRRHPDDPNALGIRYTVARIVAQRLQAGFVPTREEVWAAINEMLENHLEDTTPVLVDALLFARGEVGYGGAPHPERHYSELALAAALRVEQAAREQGDTRLAERMEKVREERIEPRLEPDFEQRRYQEMAESPEMRRELAAGILRLMEEAPEMLEAELQGRPLPDDLQAHVDDILRERAEQER